MKIDWDKVWERKCSKRNKKKMREKRKARWKLELREARLIKTDLTGRG